MSPAIETAGLGKRYGRSWALRNVTMTIPAGRVVGLVGANGAGESTLLQLCVGLLGADEGRITVLGGRPRGDAEQLARVGFLAQDVPLYNALTVDEHLCIGRRLNPRWDAGEAGERIDRLGLDRPQRVGGLSGGQRAQLALTLAIGKRPELLLLDEPVASLDPLARREFLADLMGFAADGMSIVLSSHLLADVERVCDHLVVLAGGSVRLAGDVDELLATHRQLVGARRDPSSAPSDRVVIQHSRTDRQTTMLVRTDRPILDPSWTVSAVGLEELVLAYMSARPTDVGGPTARLRAVG